MLTLSDSWPLAVCSASPHNVTEVDLSLMFVVSMLCMARQVYLEEFHFLLIKLELDKSCFDIVVDPVFLLLFGLFHERLRS